jgi:seryl-tRNA synthetase
VFSAGRRTRLVRALLNFFMDLHRDEHGYEEIWPPLLVNRATMTGTGSASQRSRTTPTPPRR